MKRNWKKRGLLVLSIFLVPIVLLKIYFEVGNFSNENQIEAMNANQDHVVTVKSAIRHKTLARDGYDIHYYVSGQHTDNLIVFLHPAFSDHRAFDQQIDYFSKDYTVITLDFIGHGASKVKASKDNLAQTSEHLAAIIEREGFEKAHLVGVSMGALLAQYFAFTHPEKAKSLTALGAYSIHKENKEVAKAQRSSNFSLILRAIFSMKAFRRKTAEITCYTPQGKAQFYKASSLYQRKSFLVMQGLEHVIQDRENSNAQCPTLILTGEFDIELAQKMAKEWHSELQYSTSEILKNAGHCAHMDQPDAFNHMLDKFIRGI